MKRKEVRDTYNKLLSKRKELLQLWYSKSHIPNDVCFVAKCASHYREIVKDYARSRGSVLDLILIKIREYWLYKGGVTFDGVMEKQAARLPAGAPKHTVCEKVLRSAFRSNKIINDLLKSKSDET